MTGLNQLPTHKRWSLPLTKLIAHVDGVASPNTLYLRLDHKEVNTRLIVSHLNASQFLQMNTTLQYVHTESDFFPPRVEEGGIQ